MVTVTIMLSLAIGILLGAVVHQNTKIEALTEEFEIYKDATKYKIKQIENNTYGRTNELDDMYQSLNSRLNKHELLHITKGV